MEGRICLQAVDRSRNVFRAWRLEIGRDLFGLLTLRVTFGRTGTDGRTVTKIARDDAQARETLRLMLVRRRGRRNGLAWPIGWSSRSGWRGGMFLPCSADPSLAPGRDKRATRPSLPRWRLSADCRRHGVRQFIVPCGCRSRSCGRRACRTLASGAGGRPGCRASCLSSPVVSLLRGRDWRGPCDPRLSASAEGLQLGRGGLAVERSGGRRPLVGLPVFAGDLGVGMYRAFGGGLQRVGGQTGLGREPAGAGGLRLEAVHAVAVLVAIVVGELAGEVASLRDLAAVERRCTVGGTDEGTDDPLQMDAHGGVVDGGLQGLGGEADLLLCALADRVVVDRVESEGGAHLLGLAVRGCEPGDQLEGDGLTGLCGAGLLGGLLGLAGHVQNSLAAEGCAGPMPASLPLGCASFRPGIRRAS